MDSAWAVADSILALAYSLSIPLNGFITDEQWRRILETARMFFQFHWMDSARWRASRSGAGVRYFQFHWMDSDPCNRNPVLEPQTLFQFHWMDSIVFALLNLLDWITTHYFQFHWMDSHILGLRTLSSQSLFIDFQFHWMDSTCYYSLLPSVIDTHDLSIPLNGFRLSPQGIHAPPAMPFNSIEWIRYSTWWYTIGFTLFQFHWMDSNYEYFYPHELQKIDLSIPLNGFSIYGLGGCTPGTVRLSIPLNGFALTDTSSDEPLDATIFQFHWMDSSR